VKIRLTMVKRTSPGQRVPQGAVAAGHPQTAAAGAQILAEGGNAVDACIAAAFASWVVESTLTGPGAGGFCLVRPADGRPPRIADFFVAVPGIGRSAPAAPMHAVDVGFGGDGVATQRFLVGEPANAVPGAAAGLEALHRAYGSLPWPELTLPAIELAEAGAPLTAEQAFLHEILDPILRHTSEGKRLYTGPSGGPIRAGELLRSPDLAATIRTIAGEGSRALYEGELARRIVAAVESGGGALSERDLGRYRVVWRRPVRARFGVHELISNPPPSSGGLLVAYGLALLAASRRSSRSRARTLVEVMREQERARAGTFASQLRRGGLAARLLSAGAIEAGARRLEQGAPAPVFAAGPGGTTHISVVDGAGDVASLSCSTGSGSGVVVPGTGIHLNNMLGEEDLAGAGLGAPGTRLTSMMAPSVALGPDGPCLVVGSAGSARLRGAIMQVVDNVAERGMDVAAAIEAPRIHVEGDVVHCEGGLAEAELVELEEAGYEVVRWPAWNLFFGGTNAVEIKPDGRLAAAGDPRRGGAGIVL